MSIEVTKAEPFGAPVVENLTVRLSHSHRDHNDGLEAFVTPIEQEGAHS